MRHLIPLGDACVLVLGALLLAGCAEDAPRMRPIAYGATAAGLTSFDAPSCGARIFVAMGLNQRYPDRDNMRVPLGDLYLDGKFVDKVSKNPEVTVLDVPAGKTQLSWVPSSYDAEARTTTRQNNLTLNLSDGGTAFVVLDWYDDSATTSGFTPAAYAFRTEVAEAHGKESFAGKRIVFHRTLDTPCATMTAAAAPPEQEQAALSIPVPQPALKSPAPRLSAPTLSLPEKVAPSAPEKSAPAPQAAPSLQPAPPQTALAAPATPPPPPGPPVLAPTPPAALPPAPPPATQSPPPEPPHAAVASLQPPTAPPAAPLPATTAPSVQSDQTETEVSQAFIASAQFYYVVNVRDGAPAFSAPGSEVLPVYLFADSTELKVVEVSADQRWLKVLLPNGRTGFVSASLVTRGMRAPK